MQDGKIMINEAEAEIVRDIFRKRSEGKSIYSLTKEMMKIDPEYFTEDEKKSSNKISVILYNRKYAGEKGYEPIVDIALFEKVQKMKGRKYSESTRETKHKDTDRQRPVSSIYVPGASVYEKEDELREAYTGGDIDNIQRTILELAAVKYECVEITTETRGG